MMKDENVRLKTKLQIAEHQIDKKDKIIDDLIMQQENLQGDMKIAGRK